MPVLKTIKGKEIILSQAFITIEKNDRIDSGYFIDLKLTGKLPKCRKDAILTHMHLYEADAIAFSTLFEYREYHTVMKSDLLELVKTLPIIQKNYFKENKFELTPEIKELALNHIVNIYCK